MHSDTKTSALVIINRFSGKGRLSGSSYLDQLETLLQKAAINPKLLDIQDLAAFKKDAIKQYDIVVAVGGDGTVRAVVEKWIDFDITLGIIPQGSYNHLAKDLGIPLGLSESVEVLANGQRRKIDFATVNDRLFLNNSSVGMYPKAVRYRDAYKDWMKWLAKTVAIINIFKSMPFYAVTYQLEQQTYEVVTPLVLVSNNKYELELLRLSYRERLDEGCLYLYINQSKSRWDFLKLLFDVLFRRKKKIKGRFVIKATKECTVNFKKKNIAVAMDGEVQRLANPLHYKIEARKLTVILPRRS